jgi:hypothetical protein
MIADFIFRVSYHSFTETHTTFRSNDFLFQRPRIAGAFQFNTFRRSISAPSSHRQDRRLLVEPRSGKTTLQISNKVLINFIAVGVISMTFPPLYQAILFDRLSTIEDKIEASGS